MRTAARGAMGTARLLTADRIGGLIWFVFGAAIVYGSWTMDRLESQNIPPVTAPGLVPGLLGAGIMAFALVLLLRSGPALTVAPIVPAVAADIAAAQPAPEPEQAFHWKRVAVSLVLCLTYGAVLLGSGVHYGILTAAFLFLHILLLDETEHVPARFTLRRLVTAAIIAPTVATIVTLVFQHLFLVRLP